MDRNSSATLHRKGAGTLAERLIASGTMEDMVNRIMREEPNRRRDFTVIQDSMEYQAAEVENLAMQFKGMEGGDKRIVRFRVRPRS